MDDIKKSPNEEGNPSIGDPLWSRRYMWLFAVPLLIAIVFFLVAKEWERWDNPEGKPITLSEEYLSYKGNSIKVSIEGRCPLYLIESRKSTILLTFNLKQKSPSNAPSKRPPHPGPSSSGQPAADKESGEHTQNLALSMSDLWVSTWIESSGADVKSQYGLPEWDLGLEQQLPSGITAPAVVSITPNASGTLQVFFYFRGYNTNKQLWGEPFEPKSLEWRVDVRPAFQKAMAPFFYSALIFALSLVILFLIDRRFRQLRRRTKQQLLDIRDKAAANPDETHFVWESARIKLEAYFDRNLIQVNLVFWLAVLVMAVGFGFVLAGVILSYKNPTQNSTAPLAAIAGIITQFIGATFMVIYRSTMKQANEFMSVLERINTVGMAVHELNHIPDSLNELKNQVRSKLVELLIRGNRLYYKDVADSKNGPE